MAITSTQSIKFSNEQARVLARRLFDAYSAAKDVLVLWNAQGHSAAIPNDAGEVLSDTAATDGRTVITGADIHLVMVRATELVADYEATSNAKLNSVAKPSNN